MSDVLKRLKYDLDRATLEKIYFSFMRPKLEYASQVWDNCSKKCSEKLEQFQTQIARTVTGARKGTSRDLIYSELQWETLSSRRENVKILNMHKIVNDNAPTYLCNLIPKEIEPNRYNLRNPNNIKIPKTRTETFRKSFIPSGIKVWNNLNQHQKMYDYEELKKDLKPKENVNKLFYLGTRSTNIKHAQLRLNCSKLNSHLHSLHVLDDPSCPCGSDNEDIYHYFYICPLFTNQRQRLLHSIRNFNITDWQMLLYGNTNLDLDQNAMLFKFVHEYIENTGRL